MKKPIIGYFPGVWDLLHAGHVLALEEAKSKCDFLVVGLGISPHIGNPSKSIPIMSFEERYKLLKANKFVDAIIVYDSEYDSKDMDKWLPYDIRFMGIDHKGRDHSYIKTKIHYVSRNHNYSSTELRQRIYEAEKSSRNRK